MDLSSYQEKKQDVAQALSALSEIATSLEMENLSQNIEKQLHDLDQEDFQLVVVGEFSRGKSTFVNAMLGRRILPSSKKPTTAVISRIVYADEPHFVLHFKDKRKRPKELTEEQFLKLTAPKEASALDARAEALLEEQQALLDTIDVAEVGYPLSFCKDHVTVVDTPGTNDLNTGRIEITYRYIEQADAVILVLAANQALTRSEYDFLKERILGNQIEDIFFVINFKDELDGPQAEREVLSYVQEKLREHLPELPKNLKIHLLSSRQALLYRRRENGEDLKAKYIAEIPDDFRDTGFPDFEEDLGDFLAEEKGQKKLAKYARRGLGMISKIDTDLAMRINLAAHSADEIQAKVAKLEPEFRRAKDTATQITQRMKQNLEVAETRLTSECTVAMRDMRDAAKKAVDDYSGDFEKSLIQHEVDAAITRVQKSFINKIRSVQTEIFNRELDRTNEELHQLWDDLYLDYQGGSSISVDLDTDAILDFDFSVPTSSSSSDGGSTVGAIIGGVLGAIVAGPLGALAGGFFGGLFGGSSRSESPSVSIADRKRKIQSSIRDRFSKAPDISKQVVAQYREQTAALCSQVEASVHQRVDDMEHQLNMALQQKQAQEAESHADIDRLHADRRRLQQVRLSLQVAE